MPFDFRAPGILDLLQELVRAEIPDILDSQYSTKGVLELIRSKVKYNTVHNISFGNISINGNPQMTGDQTIHVEVLLKDLGFAYDYMVVSCSFDGVQCIQDDFTWSYSFQYGNCFTFNKQIK